MQYLFTPAALRALAHASRWASCGDCEELTGPALLLGLLEEEECRAAIVLSGHGVDAAAVHKRWPELKRRFRSNEPTAVPPERLSPDVEQCLQAAWAGMVESCGPGELATEHVLLGLVAGQHEVADWLRQHGCRAEEVLSETSSVYVADSDRLPPEVEQQLQVPLCLWEGAQEEPGCRVEISAGPEGGGRLEDGTQQASPLHGPAEKKRVVRIVDAAANRAREGLRVVEDYVRFVLDDGHLTSRCKQLRHDLTAALQGVSARDRLAARETLADVGTAVATSAEQRRESAAEVVAAAFARLQEALRSLEEYGKLLDAEMAERLEQIRYRSYTLQRAAEITRTSLQRLQLARLCVLIDGRSSLEELRRLGGALVGAAVDVIQLRDKRLDDRRLIERACMLRELTREGDTLLVINDRADLAAVARADGVHVGQEDLSVKHARTIVGPEALVGVSTHSIEQARQAVLDGADYIGVGPVFPSETKHFDEFPGLELLRAVVAEIRLPAFAIGGITGENLSEVLATGITRVALSGAVATAPDPAAAAGQLLVALGRGDEGWEGP